MGTYILPRFLISKLRSKETTPFLESIPPEQEELEFERFCDSCGAKIRPIFNDSNELIQCILLDKSVETVKKALAWGEKYHRRLEVFKRAVTILRKEGYTEDEFLDLVDVTKRMKGHWLLKVWNLAI